MPQHSYTRIWVHLIWGTDKRKLAISDLLREDLNAILRTKANQLGIDICTINLQPDHVHVLLQLSSNMSISIVAKQLKGVSSRLINLYIDSFSDFSWQKGYGAFSVSSSALDTVKRYIKNQNVHHKRMTFKEEYELWAEHYRAGHPINHPVMITPTLFPQELQIDSLTIEHGIHG